MRIRYLKIILSILAILSIFLGVGRWVTTNGNYTKNNDLSVCVANKYCNDLLAVAHRGTTFYILENTLAAFQLSYEHGVDVIELDVRNTLDDELVVIHDDTVDRTTDGSGEVSQMTLAEIKKLTIKSHYPGIPDQKIPTFKEALLFLKGKLLIDVDIKTDNLEKLVSEIKECDMLNQVFLLTKSIEIGKKLLEIEPSVTLMPRAHSYKEVYEYIESFKPLLIQIDAVNLNSEILHLMEEGNVKIFVDVTGTLDPLGQIAYASLYKRGTNLIETDRFADVLAYARRVNKR